MWLLTTVSQSAWLVFSPGPGAPPVFRFRQPYGSWACGPQQHPPPPPSSNLYSVTSGPPHIIDQSASLFFLAYTEYFYLREQPLACTPQKAGTISSYPLNNQPSTSYRQHSHHVAKPLQFDLAHLQSGLLASFLSCPNPPKIVSCFYPALCSSNGYRGFETAWSMATSSYLI